MKTRKLGKSGLEINGPLVFGGNVFGWTVDEQASFRLLDAFVGAGLNCVDTADVYSRWKPGNQGGESETILGKWMHERGNRAKVRVLTKVGMDMGEGKVGLSRAYILRAVEDSLRRLRTDYIDLYQSHKDDESTPVEETLEAYDQLVKQGKVLAIGASNFSAERLEDSLRVSREKGLPRYESLQPLYNLYDRAPFEEKLVAVCQQEQLGVIPYFSLAKGFLAGKYRSEADLGKSARGQGVKEYLNDRGFRILRALDEVSRRLNATPARVSLAWLMHRPGVTAPIASATSLAQLNELVEATRLDLDAVAMELLNSASA